MTEIIIDEYYRFRNCLWCDDRFLIREAISYFIDNFDVFALKKEKVKKIYIPFCCYINMNSQKETKFSVSDLITLYNNSDFKFTNELGNEMFCFRIEARYMLNWYKYAYCYDKYTKDFYIYSIDPYREDYLEKIKFCLNKKNETKNSDFETYLQNLLLKVSDAKNGYIKNIGVKLLDKL